MRASWLLPFLSAVMVTSAYAEPSRPSNDGGDATEAGSLQLDLEPAPSVRKYSLGLPPLALNVSAPDATGRPADLFPGAVFSADAPVHAGSRERSPAVRFGDSWKQELLAIGGMTAGFAALAALCGSGKCLLPKELGSWIPGNSGPAPPAPMRVGPRVGNVPTMR